MPPRPAPAATSLPWLRYLAIVLTVLTLFAMFTVESADADTWIHLRTGQWMLANHKLPIPDPFAWTTYIGKPVYADEYFTRDFNLKHEWLGQVIQYLEWSAGGVTGMILFRAACVAGFCLITGWIVWRRTSQFYLAIAAVLAAATLARGIAVDRPYVMTYLLLAATMWILESRRALWLLPPLFVVWANLHGGYFTGLIVVGAYCAEALAERLRGKPPADERMLWACGIAAVLASGLNPTYFGIVRGMLAYRQSFMQNTLREWHAPAVLSASWFSALLAGAVLAMLASWRRVRVADWILLAVFGVLALMAERNTVFVALVGPVMIASYLPRWKRTMPRWTEFAAVAVVALIAGERIANGRAFEFRIASWKFPDGAVKFLKDHNVSGPMFNIYEWGGYLMWAGWPLQKTFVDGRALNESVFRDYMRIAFNCRGCVSDAEPPKLDFRALNVRSRDGQQLLDQYGAEVILIQAFEYGNGSPYYLAPSIAVDPVSPWKLVFQDDAAMVFMRQPPEGVQPLPREAVFASMESQCLNEVRHLPWLTGCARYLDDLYGRLNAPQPRARWRAVFEQELKGAANAGAR
jgi:hypothetical protein